MFLLTTQDAVMSDSRKFMMQYVHHESSDKFIAIKRHYFNPIGMTIILVLESH
jgi:S-adenosylmethionine/arginine decarboxylase-like enzyme